MTSDSFGHIPRYVKDRHRYTLRSPADAHTGDQPEACQIPWYNATLQHDSVDFQNPSNDSAICNDE